MSNLCNVNGIFLLKNKINILESMEKRTYKKRTMWGQRAEALLLELWAEQIKELRGAKKNGHVYKHMAFVLEKNNEFVSADEVKVKIHNWTAKYRTEKAKVGVSGGSPSDWQYYQRVHEILGSFKINNVEALVEDSLMYESNEITEVFSPMPEPSPLLVPPSQTSPMLVSSPQSSPPESLAPTISSSKSTSEPSKSSSKKGKQNCHTQLLKRMEIFEKQIEKQHEEINNVAKEMTQSGKRSCDLLEELVKNTVEMNNAFIEHLKKQ